MSNMSLSALPCFGRGGVHDYTAFRDVIREFNDRLFFACRREMLIGFHSHDGFGGNPVSVWSRDGIHPNSYRGRQLYKKSLRQALFWAFSQAFTPLQ